MSKPNSETRILVVDDRENWRTQISGYLSYAGYDVQAVRDFDEAEQLIESEVYDLVMLDIRNGESESFNMAGLHLLTCAKEQPQAPRTILMSAYPESIRAAKNDIRYQPDDVLFKKSLKKRELLAMVERLLS